MIVTIQDFLQIYPAIVLSSEQRGFLYRCFEKVSRQSLNPAFDECWVWDGSLDQGGYGRIGRNGVNCSAYREIFELVNGPLKVGYEPDHLCKVKACINPRHLEGVTKRVNILRGNAEGCLLYTSPSPRDLSTSRMPSSA